LFLERRWLTTIYSIERETQILRIGPPDTAEELTIYKDLLKREPHFFNTICTTNTSPIHVLVEVPNHDFDVVKLYCHWLYSEQTYSKQEHAAWISQKATEFSLLIRAYAFGFSASDIDSQDTIIDAIIEKTLVEHNPPASEMQLFSNAVPRSCSARQFFVDLAAWDGTADMFTPGKGNLLDKSCLWHILHTMATVRLAGGIFVPEDAPYYRNTCRYHEHTKDGQPCYIEGAEERNKQTNGAIAKKEQTD